MSSRRKKRQRHNANSGHSLAASQSASVAHATKAASKTESILLGLVNNLVEERNRRWLQANSPEQRKLQNETQTLGDFFQGQKEWLKSYSTSPGELIDPLLRVSDELRSEIDEKSDGIKLAESVEEKQQLIEARGVLLSLAQLLENRKAGDPAAFDSSLKSSDSGVVRDSRGARISEPVNEAEPVNEVEWKSLVVRRDQARRLAESNTREMVAALKGKAVVESHLNDLRLAVKNSNLRLRLMEGDPTGAIPAIRTVRFENGTAVLETIERLPRDLRFAVWPQMDVFEVASGKGGHLTAEIAQKAGSNSAKGKSQEDFERLAEMGRKARRNTDK